MLKIKLTPTGKRNHRQHRIVVAEDREKLTGNITEHLGHFDPHAKADQVKLNRDLYQSWLGKGAQPTQTIRALGAKLT